MTEAIEHKVQKTHIKHMKNLFKVTTCSECGIGLGTDSSASSPGVVGLQLQQPI